VVGDDLGDDAVSRLLQVDRDLAQVRGRELNLGLGEALACAELDRRLDRLDCLAEADAVAGRAGRSRGSGGRRRRCGLRGGPSRQAGRRSPEMTVSSSPDRPSDDPECTIDRQERFT